MSTEENIKLIWEDVIIHSKMRVDEDFALRMDLFLMRLAHEIIHLKNESTDYEIRSTLCEIRRQVWKKLAGNIRHKIKTVSIKSGLSFNELGAASEAEDKLADM